MSTFKLGIVGYPLGHSLSPLIHSIFLDQAGLTGAYERFPVEPDGFESWIHEVAGTLQGFNVTIPYKIRIQSHLKSLSEEAQCIGAVNTVCVQEGVFHGHNTDAKGFLAPLSQLRTPLKESDALILGAGGASRAVAYALIQANCKALCFAVRNLERARPTVEMFQREDLHCHTAAQINLVQLEDMVQEDLNRFSLLINTTPVGMSPDSVASPLPTSLLAGLPEEALVYDLIYNPRETRLLREARSLGYRTQEGLPMLIHQAAQSFYLWTGQAPSAEALQAALSACSAHLQTDSL